MIIVRKHGYGGLNPLQHSVHPKNLLKKLYEFVFLTQFIMLDAKKVYLAAKQPLGSVKR